MPGDDSLREAVTSSRTLLDEGRDRIRETHDRGLKSVQVCGRLTSLVDNVVTRLFTAVLGGMGEEQASVIRANAALAALGSFGRRQLAPYSDVDLMIVQGKAGQSEIAVFAEQFLKAMYDVGLHLAQSVRKPAEIVQLSKNDAVICTSLIDTRLIVGNQPLYEEFRTRFGRMAGRRAKALSRAFLETRTKERKQYGESVYLLEPNVKRSRGALRDLNLLRWLAFAEHGESDPDRLQLIGALSKFEHHRLTSARSWLLRLRNEMHFHAGKANESLDRAEQLRIAEVFGHAHRSGLLPVEHLMRDYFRHTGFVWQLVRRRKAHLDVEESTLTKMLDPVLGRSIEGDYHVGVRKISATPAGQAKLRSSLTDVLRLVQLSTQEGKLVDQPVWSTMLLAAPDCPDQLDDGAVEAFLDILRQPSTVAETLRTLHELGYLEKVVPPMRHARCLLQFNQYHKYTVDEHCLRAVKRATEFSRRDDQLGRAYQQIERKDVVHLALLLHDLGKGFDEDHSDVGLRLAAETAERFQLDPEATECLEFLVHRHLLMSHLSFRRDTSDPLVMQEFVDQVGSVERLRMLFVVTCADLAAVGPGVLSKWKAEVLRNLYLHANALLGEAGEAPASHELGEARERVWQQLVPQEREDDWFARQTAALSYSLLIMHPPAWIAQTLRRLHRLEPRGAVSWAVNNHQANTVELVAGVDQGPGRGVFSSMAGVLSSERLQILSADTEVLDDNLLLLHFAAHDRNCPDGTPEERLDEISAAMIASVDCLDPPKFRRVWGQEAAERRVQLSATPNVVRVDNRASSRFTAVEVVTFDRMGLLYALARKLHDIGLVIQRAKIGGRLDQVVDVFFVTDRDGNRIEAADRIEHIHREMHSVIDK